MKIISFSLVLSLLLSFLPGCSNKKNKKEETPVITAPDSSRLNIMDNKVNPYAIVDVSPMDISYFPADYPKLKMENASVGPPLARIIYSRPHLQGRKLFLTLLKYEEPWRLGANESTELDLYSDAIIQEKRIKAGRYVLYSIPHTDTWTIVLNTNIDSWGLHPDSTRDIARFTIPVKKTSNQLEYYTMLFEKTASGADIIMAWDDLEARLPVIFMEK